MPGLTWVWMQRAGPRKPRVPCANVLAGRVAKEILLMAEPQKFFTEPHYDGFPAVLVRLKEVGHVAELRKLLTHAWTARAPRALLAQCAKKRA